VQSASNSLIASATSPWFFVVTPKLRLFAMSRPVKLNPFVGRPRHHDALFEQPHLRLPKALFPAAVRVRDERADGHTSSRRRFEAAGDFVALARLMDVTIGAIPASD
jgi:hypothetical protein